MSRAVQRVGDRNSAGGLILRGDNSVLVNGRAIAVQNAPVSPHPCCGAQGCPPIHCNAQTRATIGTILVNGIPLIVLNDTDTCGHPRVGGSPNVVVG
jgi:uncharacterized Zn-binding protein involved in type VI secretion